MADYCLQCSVDLDAPEGWSDFKDETLPGGVLRANLCEGCGAALTDRDGRCHATRCLKRHGVSREEVAP